MKQITMEQAMPRKNIKSTFESAKTTTRDILPPVENAEAKAETKSIETTEVSVIASETDSSTDMAPEVKSEEP
ncbi:MAG: hypothetical protein N3G19_03850, partial [Candidatus Pacearchaeota archaeon]|nr:hypothetical protein [Candidatus Pacearchaeota archaeon]